MFNGKRRQDRPDRLDPSLPAVPRPIAPAAQHEKTAQALAYVTHMNEELDFLREENGRLRADLNLARMRCRDLETERDQTRHDMEAYRRYAVEVKTHLQTIVDVATRANDCALAAGDQPGLDQQAEKLIDNTERELRDLASSDIAAKYGANANKDAVTEPQHG